ncbi:MAG: hypothetical protein ACI92E_000431 [Oceanicoccus sp.]|jgi:hypothetical protein
MYHLWRITILLIILQLVACGQEEEISAPDNYHTVADAQQIMLWILEPSADVIWQSAGSIITIEGEQDLTPTTVEQWQKVVNSAAMVAESGNLLMMPGRAQGDDWLEYSQGLIEAGTQALEAAQSQDGKALFDAGGQIYQVCKACHNQYMPK